MKKLALSLIVLFVALPAAAQETKIAALKADAKSKPTDAQAAFALGRAYRRAGRWNEAKVELARAATLAKGEESARARFELAMVDWDSGAKNPSSPSPTSLATCKQIKVDALAHACAAEAWLTMERIPMAEDALAAAEKADVNLYEAKIARARVAIIKGQHDDAITKLKAITVATPSRAEAWFLLGKEQLALDKRADAAAALRKARDVDADWPEVSFELSRALPDGTEARDLARQAVAMRTTWPAAWLRLGELELATGGYEQAKSAFETSIKQSPKVPAAHAGLAMALVKSKKFADAKKAAQDAIGLAANDAQARLAMGEAQAGLGEVDEAVESFKFASSLDAKDPTGLVRAVEVLLAAKQPVKAEAHAEAAVKAFADDARTWNVKGDVDLANGDKKAARESFKKALSSPKGTIDKSATQKKLDSIK